MQGSLTERVTRSLAYMLRHQPEEFDLELDRHGFAELSEVVCALNERLGEPVEEGDVVRAIESGDRPRYEIEEGRIRALYGHSIPIDPGEPSDPPELLYVGVGSRDASRAERHGLEGGRRAFLHLAIDYEDARETGRRIAPSYAVVTVRAREAARSGIPFYDRKALFLSGAIPTEFLVVSETYDDGVRREDRDDSRRSSRRRPGSRTHSGSRERSEDREYPEARERPERRERSESRAPSKDRLEPRSPRRDRDEEPLRATPPRVREVGPKPSSGGSGGFGLGIFQRDDAAAGREEPPRADTRADTRTEPRRRSEPAREAVSEAPEDDASSGFGSGIF